jgi:8-oxo-dGTP pyrophosphatase MutT (NUDIX family)
MTNRRVYDGFTKISITDDGKEVTEMTDAVAVFVYHRTRGILLIEQDRSAMRGILNEKGTILEVVAGRLDHPGMTLHEIVIDELKDEAGVVVSEGDIVFLQDIPLATSPGISTERMYLAYVQVDDTNLQGSDGDTFGLAEEGERIKRQWVSIDEAKRIQWNDLKSWALYQWFLLLLRRRAAFI